MKDCKEIAALVFEYLDKECCQANEEEIEKHLADCRGCFDRFEFERLLRDHIRITTNHPCPEKLKQRIKKLIDQF